MGFAIVIKKIIGIDHLSSNFNHKYTYQRELELDFIQTNEKKTLWP